MNKMAKQPVQISRVKFQELVDNGTSKKEIQEAFGLTAKQLKLAGESLNINWRKRPRGAAGVVFFDEVIESVTESNVIA